MTPTDPLEIVAPSASLDPLAPWFGARTSQERALAATFWTSLGGLSGLFHATAIFFSLVATLLPIPFFSEACSSVKPVSFRPPERVEVAIVKVEPLPVVEELEPPPELEEAPAPPKGAKAKKLAAEIDKMNVGMLALLGTTDSVSGVFGTLDSGPDSAVFGALIGDEIGDSFGVGGLGLSGVGVTGGVAGGVEGGGSIGLGGLGTLGHAAGGGGGTGSGFGSGKGFGSIGEAKARVRVDIVDTDLDRELARRTLSRAGPALEACASELPADLTLRVRDGIVGAAEGAPTCVAKALIGRPLPGTGHVAIHIEPR